MIEDAELLRRYAEENSEPAFAELVERRIALVYAVALRQCGGDAHLAEDVTQTVFTALARKSGELAQRPVLSGWLCRSAQFAASDVVRAERRRRQREQAAEFMQPEANAAGSADHAQLRRVLDQAMADLPDDDRDAVALRFFEGRAFADIGRALRLTEEAARKRVDRALGKLHASLRRRGLTSTTVALGLALAEAGSGAPAGLAATVTGAALAGTSASVASAAAMTLANLGLVIAGLVAITALGLATAQARAARDAQTAIADIARESASLEARLAALARRQAIADERTKIADADAAQLLAAIQANAPIATLPSGDSEGVAFVIDTSGSMRNPSSNGLWRAVEQAVRTGLASHPQAKFVQVFDAAGREIFGRKGGWAPLATDTLPAIDEALRRYDEDTASDPSAGIFRAMQSLPARSASGPRLHVWVIGDELNVPDPAATIRRLDEGNPPDRAGRRAATINTIQLPTTERTPGVMAGTGQKFQALMTEAAKQTGGRYTMLPARVLQEDGPNR